MISKEMSKDITKDKSFCKTEIHFPGIEFTAGTPPFQISAVLSGTLEGINLYVGGGTAPHIGAVVISIPRPSLEDPARMSCTTSVYNCIGHKDDVLATIFSESICRKFHCTVVVSAGIHNDNIEQTGIEKFRSVSLELLGQIENYISGMI